MALWKETLLWGQVLFKTVSKLTSGGNLHGLLGDDLLALSEADVVEVLVDLGEAEFLAEGLDVLERVHAGAEDEEHGRRGTWNENTLN